MSISDFKPAVRPRIQAALSDAKQLLQDEATKTSTASGLAKKLVDLGEQHGLTRGGLGIAVNRAHRELGLDETGSSRFNGVLDQATRTAVDTMRASAKSELYQVFRDVMTSQTYTEEAWNSR